MKKITFPEYWAEVKKMEHKERASFFSSLPKNQQKSIKDSYFGGGWQDVFIKNKIDELCDTVKCAYDIDLYDIRIKVLRGKTQLIPRIMWEDILETFVEYENCFNLQLLFGGIGCRIIESNPDYCELYKI